MAQQLELVALFVAQMQTSQLGATPVNLRLPLEAHDGGDAGWVDLIVADSGYEKGQVAAANRRDSRLRQVKTALKTLEAKTLVELPNAKRARGKFEGFQLLDEGGPRLAGEPIRYRIPEESKSFAVPVEFFLRGWVHVLTPSEISLWLMLRHLGASQTWPDGIHISGDGRRRHYGLSHDAYKSWPMLEQMGLIRMTPDPSRRADGTVIGGMKKDEPVAAHRFELLDDGLEQDAGSAVIEAIQHQLAGKPIGMEKLVAGAESAMFAALIKSLTM
ncbi:hypothetical protein [Oerskovia paurometabola]|uniref:hypothetical protein n=1 Tax=Oerskovia paurometabola TaxID=162170 RepID=UPI003419A38C